VISFLDAFTGTSLLLIGVLGRVGVAIERRGLLVWFVGLGVCPGQWNESGQTPVASGIDEMPGTDAEGPYDHDERDK
jgi:hypothetical protein